MYMEMHDALSGNFIGLLKKLTPLAPVFSMICLASFFDTCMT